MALKWYRKAAEQGHAEAQNNLALLYTDGKGVAQDYKKALKWYRMAAEQGYARAQTNLGRLYSKGYGLLSDKVLAHMWSNVAGANGDKSGAENRARLEERMTFAQIAEAQELARECMKKKYKGCER
jgi:hypothetical protein